MEKSKISISEKLLEPYKKQRKTYIRLANGEKEITNHSLYNSYEEEIYILLFKIGAINKKELKKNKEYMIRVKSGKKEGEPWNDKMRIKYKNLKKLKT